jgi:hypothetical protein
MELILGVALITLAMGATSGMFLAGKWHMQMQQRELETTQAARAAVDMIVRDLRLGGACLPVTGDFISLEGTNNGTTDTIITRTGLTRPDLSCVSTVVPQNQAVTAGGSVIPVQSADGFATGMTVYIRNPNGEGEYFKVSSVSTSPAQLGKSTTLTQDYPATSGLYAIDARRFFIDTWNSPRGPLPQLMLQVADNTPQPLAVGIEKLDLQYQLQRNCPPCDVINLPSTDAEWTTVDAVIVNLTARSDLPDKNGNYYRRSVRVNVKPRNLLPK